jgi:hypothetical protein
MTHKQLFSFFCITFSFYTYPTPVNIPVNNDFIRQHFVQPIQTHPKKTIIGAPTIAYGLKLVYEGIKTHNIQPDPNNRYDSIGSMTKTVGGILISIGAALLYPVIRDMVFPENSTTEKTDKPELPKK